jgi:hypothetical protein
MAIANESFEEAYAALFEGSAQACPQNLSVKYLKFNRAGISTNGYYTQNWITELNNCLVSAN